MGCYTTWEITQAGRDTLPDYKPNKNNTKMDNNPNKKQAVSIREQLKRDLLDGQVVTPLYGLQVYGTMDLRKRLSELRKEDGMEITSEWHTNPATGKHYRVHYMTTAQRNQYAQV